MGKNDFDTEFDFEKEYGFDPNLFLSSDDDFDYDQFLNDGTAGDVPETDADYAEEPEFENYDLDEDTQSEEDLSADIPVRRSYAPAEEDAEAYDEVAEYSEEEYAEEEPPAEEDDVSDEDGESERPARRKKKAAGFQMPKLPKREKSDKPKQPSAFSKLLDAYMEPVTRRANEAEDLDPLDPRVIRRKKREKKRIFKEVYLPAIIAGCALFLIISFIVGFSANLVRDKKAQNEAAKAEAQSQADAASRAEQEYAKALAEAERLVQGYDYESAIRVLDDFGATTDKYQQELTAKRAEYVNAQASLSEIKDTSTIANLSFHVLIADPVRAFGQSELGGQYNKNFVTVGEFEKILNQLYTGNYVLVDFNSFVKSNTGVDGNESFFQDSIYLPSGKKPIMITETMVNYFEYMVDANKDGEPDAGGHGFANKLVVDGNGDIKAAYVDANGQNLVGNYDLVPVLEDFIKEHPDFSYRGARATLAVTGTEGIFGYRTNTSYVANRGQSYYDEQVVGAKKVVEALREKGYNLACYTYSNQAYKGMTTLQIQAEMQNWANQVTPVMGDVDTIVFARASDIEAYSGTTFNVLYNSGFRYFLNNGTSPRVDVNTTFIKQTRLMVTGEAMAWYSNQFTQYFDSNMVLDMSSRGSVARS